MRKMVPALVLCLLALFVCSCSVGMPAKLHGTWRKFTTADGLLSNQVRKIAVDDSGNTWFATEQGVAVLSPTGKWKHYRVADGLAAQDAWDVAVDQRGRVWVATLGGGLSRFDGVAWKNFTSSNSNLPDDRTRRLAVDARGNIWVASRGGLSVVYADDTVVYIGRPLPEELVFSGMAIDPQGHVWVVSWDKPILAEYDPGSQQWHVEQISDHVSVSLKHALQVDTWGVAVDRKPGHLWVATNNIVEVRGETWSVYLPGDQYMSTAVFVDSEGYKWFGVWAFGSGPGVLLISPDNREWWYYRSGDPLRAIPVFDTIWSITCSPQGTYWFATDSGAIEFVPAR